MKLLITIVHDRDKNKIADTLLKSNFRFTKIASTGGFLRDGNVTFLIGVEEDRVEELVGIIKESCKSREQYMSMMPPDTGVVGAFAPNPMKVVVGGAVIFMVDVDRFEHF